jgi:DNA segregation ATPase FtsK/SpoIIIE-like protein
VGVDAGLNLICADLASPNHAHLLVAGSAGSGKSEWLRMAIAGAMVANTRETLRLVLIDPKMSAFMDLRGSPWLLDRDAFWVPGEGRDIVTLLDGLVEEMDRRYALFAAARADDLEAYRTGTGKPLARIVCFCDEYFALISGDRNERKAVEQRIGLLAAKGRASGVHLVIATQQASREVIKGTLDANLSCRVGLRMPKAIESRLLLGVAGAERLTGNGDLLYRAIGNPVRLQAPYLTPAERAALFAH